MFSLGEHFKKSPISTMSPHLKANFFDVCLNAFFVGSDFNEVESAYQCFVNSRALRDSELDVLAKIDWVKMSEKFESIAVQKYMSKRSNCKNLERENIKPIPIRSHTGSDQVA